MEDLACFVYVSSFGFSSCSKDPDIVPPVPPTPTSSIEQSAVLYNDVELSYSASISNVNNVTLTVSKDGTLILTETVNDISTGNDYTKTLNYASDNKITKGTYEFKLKNGNLEKTTSVTIPNYLPTMDLSGVKADVKEYLEINVTLPNPTDKNPEDPAGTITSAESVDGKTQLTLNGYNLKISTVPKNVGTYQVKLKFGSIVGGIGEAILQGTIIPETRIVVNPFKQPNDSTLNWYGSGDVNKDNIVNSSDLTRIVEVINGTYTNPSDKRLMDRANINGDGIVNTVDRDILEKKLLGSIKYLPGEWNKLTTRSERFDWVKKMFAMDKTYFMPFPGGNCIQASNQLTIDFRGFNETDIAKFLTFYPYDVTNNGRFNMPVLEVSTSEYDAEGKFLGGHLWNTIVVGDNMYNWNDLCNIEPQDINGLNVQPGQMYFYGLNTLFDLRGPPISLGNKIMDMQNYCGYDIKNYIPTFNSWESLVVKVINQRIK